MNNKKYQTRDRKCPLTNSVQFFYQKTIHIARRLEEKACFGIAQFLKEMGGIDGIKGLLK